MNMTYISGRGPRLWTVFAAIAMWIAPSARGQIVPVTIDCFDINGECIEVPDANPIFINVGEQVQWELLPPCADFPCSGVCRIDVPPGVGFPGYNQNVIAPGFSPPTPQFLADGVFPYILECSPPLVGTIVVGQPGLTIFSEGTCPGTMSLESTNATPGASIYFTYGFSTGSTPIPGCPGVTVDLDNARIAGSAVADDGGRASISGMAPPVACGSLMTQAVEPSSCMKSNVWTIP